MLTPSRARLLGFLLAIGLLSGCSKLPLGDPAPPEVGLAVSGGSLGIIVPLCPGERVTKVVLTPDEQDGSPAPVWTGVPTDGASSRLLLGPNDFTVEGAYQLSHPLVVEVSTSRILYVSTWSPSFQDTPPTKARFRGHLVAPSDIRPECG